MADLQSIPAGPTAKGHTPPDAGGRAEPQRPGLKDLQRALARRQWPGPDQVATGTLLRQVPPEWPEPGAQPEPVAVRMELAPSPFSPGRHVLRVVVQARPAPPPARPPANLVLAIDVSDSMNAPNRLPLVQEGVSLLAERLRPEDRVAVVAYAAEAREVRASEPVGDNGRALRDSLQALSAEGRTNGYGGLALAYAVARRAWSATGPNAVILCTDGNFNLGETDERTLAGLAARFAADGIRLSVFGFGRSDRNDLRLELLAREGGGHSCYVNTREETERLLAGQVDGLLEPVARDVVWRVAFAPALAATVQALGGEEGAAELLPGRSLTALYELDLPVGARTPGGFGEVQVDYHGAAEPGRVRRTLDVTAKDWERAGQGFRFAVAMAELARILRGPPGEAAPTLERLEAWTDKNLPDDAGGYRQDLRETVELAKNAARHRAGQ